MGTIFWALLFRNFMFSAMHWSFHVRWVLLSPRVGGLAPVDLAPQQTTRGVEEWGLVVQASQVCCRGHQFQGCPLTVPLYFTSGIFVY